MNLVPVSPSKISNYGTFNLPILQPAVNEATANLQGPLPMAQWSAISVASAASHGLADVKNPRGFVESTSIFSIVVARSGEGKTAVDSVFKRGVTRFEAARREHRNKAMKDYEEALLMFDVKKQSFAHGLRRAINDGGDVAAAEQALAAHMKTKPAKPRLFCPFMEYTTPEGWYAFLVDNVPVCTITSDEAAAIIGGRTFSRLEPYNQAWGGGPISVNTKKDGNLSLPWVRFSMGLMVQPDPLNRMLETSAKKGKENGFFARSIVCDSGTTQGTRFCRDGTVSWTYSDAFADRVEQLLEMAESAHRQEGYEPEVLVFSPEAESHFLNVHNRIEGEICVGGRYECAGDHATKLSSNIARVAAVLHFFEGFEGDISLDTLKAAQVLCEDASLDYLRLFVPPPRDLQDAMILNNWLDDYRKRGYTSIPKNYARKHCPNALRSEGRFYIAADVLINKGVIKAYVDNQSISQLVISPQDHSQFLYAGMKSFGAPMSI